VPIDQRAKRRLKIAAHDYGMKWNILRRLSAQCCDARTGQHAGAELLATPTASSRNAPAIRRR
jgi:hypothetical protein